MKKLFFILFALMFTVYAYAQENDNKTQTDTEKEQISQKTEEKTEQAVEQKQVQTGSENKKRIDRKAADFNKKKISLDRFDEMKWYARVGYSYFMPDDKTASMFNYKLHAAGGYQLNKFLSVEAFVSYSDGRKNQNVNGVDSRYSGTMYDVGAMAVGHYYMELPAGFIGPFIGVGASYTFGSVSANSIADGSQIFSKNLSGASLIGKAGLRYTYNVLTIGGFAEYTYSFTSAGTIKNFSGFNFGGEIGIKF